MPGSKARRQVPVLALDVVDNAAARPGQKCRHHQADALARTGRREAEHMLGSIMAEVIALEPSEHDAIWRGKTSGTNF